MSRRSLRTAALSGVSMAALVAMMALAVIVGIPVGSLLADTLGPRASPARIASAIVASTPQAGSPSQATSSPADPQLTSSAACRQPSSDATGASDAAPSLEAFLDSVPDGSLVCLVSNGRYRLDSGLHLTRRRGLTIDGRGATMFAGSRSGSPMLLIDGGGSGIHVLNLALTGANPNAGTALAFNPAFEGNHGISIGGTADVEIGPSVAISNVGGDGVYVTGGTQAGVAQWADGVRVHDIHVSGAGRMGIALTDGARNVTVQDSRFEAIGLYAFDLEPNGHTFAGVPAGAEHVAFVDNSVAVYGLSPALSPLLFAGTGVGPEVDVELRGTTVTGSPLRVGVWDNSGSLRRDFRIIGNSSDTPTSGPSLTFTGVDGLVVTGNVQPLLNDPLIQLTRCLNATTQ